MPYSITSNHKDCSTFAVVKDDDGKLMGCHKTRTSAKRQIAALYASEGANMRANKRVYDKGHNDWQSDSMTLLLMAYREMLNHPECEELLEPLMAIIHMKQDIMLDAMEIELDEEEEYEYALEQPTLERIKRASLRQLTKWINGMDKMGNTKDVAVLRAYVEAEIKNRISKAGLVVEKADAKRYTLGPVYVPNVEDAHGEFTDDDTLQEALWGWMQKDDRSIYLQHSETKAGEFVELLTWPFAMKAEMSLPDQEAQEFEFPANTPFMGVIWEPWAWDLVQQGELRGYSIGGTARRVEADLGGLVTA